MTHADYEGYVNWKNWSGDGFARYDANDAAYFSGELRDIRLSGCKVLELGFGNGRFLGFARDSGADVAGTELIPEARALAQSAGIKVYSADLSDAVDLAPRQFDLVVAFDVLEHLTFDEIKKLFDQLALLLRAGSVVIARFPNGASPLGCVSQYGDHTHRSVLSASLLMQLLAGKPWRLESAGNPYRANTGGNPFRRLSLMCRHLLRDGIEAIFNRIYGLKVTLDPNVTVRITRLPD